MKTFVLFLAALLVLCAGSYFIGFRAGTKQSLSEKERRGIIALTLATYDAAQATNWTKVKSFLEVELLGFTREYERRYGVPTNTNALPLFVRAKSVADQIEKRMVPMSSLATNFGSNVTFGIKKQ
jgi:hypothetical protein